MRLFLWTATAIRYDKQSFLIFKGHLISNTVSLYLQTNLLVGSYLKIDGVWFLKYTKSADELITWLRSKTQLLAILKTTYTILTGQPGLSVLRAVLTRWTAHYLAYVRLLTLRQALEAVVTNDRHKPEKEQCVIIGDTKAKAKARSMVGLILDSQLWQALEK